MSACRSCGARIVWATTTSGKAAPFEIDETGKWEIGADGVARRFPDAKFASPERYTSHFATCKNAASHRKART